jgi:hypothetical protein
MAAGSAAFGLDEIIGAVVQNAGNFVQSDTAGVGMAIFWLIFAFHVIEGAAEVLDDPRSCRLFHRKFWLRMCLVLSLLAGYQRVVVGVVGSVQTKFVMNFADKWADVWASESTSMDTMKANEADNQDVNHAEIGATKAGHGDDSWTGKIARFAVDGVVTGIGWVLASITAVLITVFILLEGFFGLGMNMVLIAVGPICVAFAAHEKTEAIFWSFVKGFLVIGLLYMPLLGVACGFAGVIMAHMTKMTQGLGAVYGDGSDIALHVIMVILGPICSFAVVRAVPAALSQLMQSMGGGSGSSFGGGAAMAMMLSRVSGGGGGGGGAAAKGDEKQGEGGGGALDAAAERGRMAAAVAEIARASAGGAGAAPGASAGSDSKADQIRGDG